MTRVNFLTTGDDTSGEQLTEFTSVRTFAGAGFSLRFFGWLRPFVNFAMEASNIGDFERTTSFFCKVNKDSPDCKSSDIISESPGWLLGANTHMGVSTRVYKELHVVASGGVSFYFFPRSEPAINFPLGFDLGLEYRF